MPRNSEVNKEKIRKKMKLPLMKRQYASYKLTVTDYSENTEQDKGKIESKIHSIKLSGNYRKGELEDILGPLEADEKYYRVKNRQYSDKYNVTIDNFRIVVLTMPLKPYLPQSSINITPPDGISVKEHKTFLVKKINDSLPGLNLSSIEFTTDIYDKDPSRVGTLFDVITKNVFIPKQRKKPVILPKSEILRKKRNRTMKIGKHKIYERGNDKDRKNKGWNREDINRVRMESTISRGQLKKYGLYCLADLLQSPKFYEINKDIWHFRVFKASNSKNLPDELDDYPHETYLGEQLEARKRKVKNLDRSFNKDMGFKDFKYDLLNAMKLFDAKWSPLSYKNSTAFPPFSGTS